MTLSRPWRGALVVPATALLTLGGALFAAPAHAESEPSTSSIVVETSPTGAEADESTEAEGTAPADTTEQQDETTPSGESTQPEATAPSEEDAQSPEAAPADDTDQADDGGQQGVDDSESTPVPAGTIEITSPLEGDTADTRTVTYTGTAPLGSSITATTEYPLLGDLALGPIPVDADGEFVVIIPFAPATENPVSVTFSGTDATGTALEPVTVSIDLPDPVDTPVITAPTATSIVGTSVTFSGTGIPGNGIAIVIVPADEASLAALATVDPLSLAAPILVQPDGTWTATYTLALGTFAVTAVHISDPSTSLIPEILSLPSAPVTFSLVAPPIVTSSINTTPVAPVLPDTGPSEAALMGPLALALLAVGAIMLGARRRLAKVAAR
ncbi:hypothetical protein [Herbiconiux sp. L3-i23]|uniref:hypothetical protein n=1 Tax=Herbiconiux sp. L3-i23 TaxID=2905871 RepID=UPI0020682443|nr:hypothetical protein [Herbiconiux sp. L3-i23]BDI24131.1 hypothetical protein L3i23_29070 [Herbiconiux sp. L3-i23]